MFYTYFHTRNDTGAIFYVGKGTGRRLDSGRNRNLHWRNTVAKHGRTSHIAAEWELEKDALLHEIFLIDCLRDLGAPLCNQTAGGDGLTSPSAETRQKMANAKRGSANAAGTRSDESKARMAAAQVGNSNATGNKSRSGQVASAEQRAKTSASVKASWELRRTKKYEFPIRDAQNQRIQLKGGLG